MKQYCVSACHSKRWKTREVQVGSVGIGGLNPIRIQSMTTSPTHDVDATVEQVIRLADAGCEIVRVTVQGKREALACEGIKNTLIKKGYNTPLVADIHFYPPAAMTVIDFVDKVRINPGNFADRRASFQVLEYDDATYANELQRIEEKFTPLVEKCRFLKKAMRIGTNHGSLSDRIMNRYGDTPKGMVESALEYARICRDHDFHDFVFSMKASNPQVMIQAYRLLVAEMIELDWDYPLHLGVTEAGDGEDGRIKSAMGIGALLLDGLGDTIRVSLTEDPWYEVDPCLRLRTFAEQYQGQGVEPFEEKHRSIEELNRRSISFSRELPLNRDGTVIVPVSKEELVKKSLYSDLGCLGENGKPQVKISSADAIFLSSSLKREEEKRVVSELVGTGIGVLNGESMTGAIRVTSLKELEEARFLMPLSEKGPVVVRVEEGSPNDWGKLVEVTPSLILLSPKTNRLHYCRHFFDWMQDKEIVAPVILDFEYDLSEEDLVIHAAAEMGGLLCDGLGEGVLLRASHGAEKVRSLSFGILQAARMRTIKTEFISCPSCGRTLFDLQDVTKRIQAKTAHLPGVKIAIMGCIVNGPGEMADAHFGYVGSRPGKIDLYVGKERVERDIDFADADDRLIALIQEHGMWKEPEGCERV